MLVALDQNLWIHETPIRFGGIPLRHRMTVIRLSDGSLMLHSPTRPDGELLDALAQLGEVAVIVAPSWWHDLWLRRWLDARPTAALYGAPTLVRWNRSLRFTGTLGNEPPPRWNADLDQACVEGIGLFLDEAIFFHRASRSLIVADLLMNIDASDAPLTRALSNLVIGKVPGCRFPRLYRLAVLDRARFRASIERIRAWDFRRIIPGHGGIVGTEAERAFAAAFAFLN